ncbi:carcinoembryonic antigen-related cell adhesion molecule 1-like isoform X3 [Hyperolius riggenbachi]|uniref:carcinoembryonic antigen-related cell adhesion molecule 1-like isoform X3 n=1 Tax=Hyperolius riggenbachi TaxID=752182 RepID=UPI0035A291A6
MEKTTATMSLFISSILLLELSGGVAAQTSHTANGVLGGSVTFNKNISSQDNPVISWAFNASTPVALWRDGIAECYDSYNGRCTLYMNGTLRLDRLTFADNGSYSMSVQRPPAPFPLPTSTYDLHVLPPLNAPILTSNGTDNKLVSDTYVSLHCDGSGQSITRYIFFRDGMDICSGHNVACSDSYLYFQPITASDSGSYTCVIQNPVSFNTSNTLQLTVSVPVSDVRLTSNASGYLWPGINATSLTCSALGTEVSYTWSLKGAPLPQDPRYQLTQGNSVLTISPVSDNDDGPFTCTASNWINNMTSNNLTFSLAGRPEGNISCSAETSGNNVNLMCSWLGGNPAANVSLIFNNQTTTEQNNVTRSVSTSSNIQGSNLTCHGDQLGRTSECTLPLEPPEAIGHDNNSITEAEAGDTVILTVVLREGLPSKFSWYRFTLNPGPMQSTRKSYIVMSTSYSSSLQIADATVNDSGKYECTANNVVGTQSFFFTVNITEKAANPIPKPSGGLDGGAIAGIVIGVLAAITIIILLVLFLLRRRKQPVKGSIYENADNMPPNIYERTMPAFEMDKAAESPESHYEQLKHEDTAVYNTMMPGQRR